MAISYHPERKQIRLTGEVYLKAAQCCKELYDKRDRIPWLTLPAWIKEQISKAGLESGNGIGELDSITEFGTFTLRSCWTRDGDTRYRVTKFKPKEKEAVP